MQYVSRTHHYIGNRRQENNGLWRIGVPGQISSVLLAVLAILACAAPAADGRDAALLSADHAEAVRIHDNTNADLGGRLPDVATCLKHAPETSEFFWNIHALNENRVRDLRSLPAEMARRQIAPEDYAGMEVLIHDYYDDLERQAVNEAMSASGLYDGRFFYCSTYNENHLLRKPCSETLAEAQSMAENDQLSPFVTLGGLKRCIDDGAFGG